MKDPKTSLERIRVAHNAFFCYETVSRGTVRRILKKYGVFSRNAAKKVSLEKKSKCFRSKWCINMLKKPFFFLQNVVFTNETTVRISSDGIFRVFRRNGTRFLEKKNTKNSSSDKRSLMFWGAIQSDVRKLLVKCPNKQNAVGYLEILKIYEEKMHLVDLIFQQDNAPVHKSISIGNFFQENEWEVLEWPAYSPDLNPIETLWAILKQQLRKQTVFWENLEEKVYEIWNEIDADVVRNLYENYTNRLLDVKKVKV